ncbi:hypothetical protein DVH24_005230 [Malus domestica]|uniref:NB-ARC domain-containing protein n=1 Tax=Malus domestica TaxID=3750 RepID=A0A498ICY7_MALDO|nr:hypothetical protein DVH24_005230 [Malus domestica]
MGRSGNTTLAKRVYHHAKVRGYFDRFFWMCVTQHCQSRKVWEDVLIGLTSGTNELKQDILKMTNAEIVWKLCNIQLQRKCLVLLDDKSLKSGFPVSAEIKSQTLLTTCCSEVALYVDINVGRSNLNSMKQKLRKQILAQCEVLPLTITVLAGLLSKKISFEEWTIVNKHVDVFVGRGMYEE